MGYEQPIVQGVSISPETVYINQPFTITVTVTEAEMVVVFSLGELFSGEV